MPIGNLERYFELGAHCPDCGWHGKVGELRSRGSDRYNAPMHCPTCDKQNTEWPIATHDVHETEQ